MSGELPHDPISLENRPGIFVIGSANVGKRTLLSRLLSVDFEDASDSSSEVMVHRWTINTKYYTADVSVSMAHLNEEFSIEAVPIFNQLAALIMVFDMSDLSSLAAIQDWVTHMDLQKFDILLCIGNKVDLIPGHPVHAEYRRRLQKKVLGDSAGSYLDATEYGISETEGTSLLGEEESSWETMRSCLEWCAENHIEYIEACASNADFDKCLSVNGDSQGVERLYGALSAHMWAGMILKSGDRIAKPSLPQTEDFSEEESDYEVDYEILSAGSADPWDDSDNVWVSSNGTSASVETGAAQNLFVAEQERESGNSNVKEDTKPSTSMTVLHDETDNQLVSNGEPGDATEPCEGTHLDFEDLDHLMSEIGNMRDSLRLMPDFQRREMAANLALKMASMFGGGSDDEEI